MGSMEYGQQLKREPVTHWHLHAINHKYLEHRIKDQINPQQGTPMAIPGHEGTELCELENEIYVELCKDQHQIDLFVSSKAGEISRRLEHLHSKIRRWVDRCNNHIGTPGPADVRYKSTNYECDLMQCGDDIKDLSTFTNSQVVIFQEILEKYQKWTGSSGLGSRFKNIASSHKSFAKQDFTSLQQQHDHILDSLQAATIAFSKPSLPSSSEQSLSGPTSPRGARIETEVRYWNEYDNGDQLYNQEYGSAVYIMAEEDTCFSALFDFHAIAITSFRKWLQHRKSAEEQSFLGVENARESYTFTGIVSEVTSSGQDDYPSERCVRDCNPPCINEPFVEQNWINSSIWRSIGCLTISFVLLGITGSLIWRGNQNFRRGLDIILLLSTLASLLFSCAGLGMTLQHIHPMTVACHVMTWSAFATSCLLNGAMLVLLLSS